MVGYSKAYHSKAYPIYFNIFFVVRLYKHAQSDDSGPTTSATVVDWLDFVTAVLYRPQISDHFQNGNQFHSQLKSASTDTGSGEIQAFRYRVYTKASGLGEIRGLLVYLYKIEVTNTFV